MLRRVTQEGPIKAARLTDDGKIILQFNKISNEEFLRIKGWASKAPGAHFNWEVKEYTIDCVQESYDKLHTLNFSIHPDLYRKMNNVVVDESWKRLKVPSKYSYLYPDQQEAFKFAMANDWKILMASSMGAGKTNTSLSLLDYTEHFPCLIICPTIVKGGWRDEHAQWLGTSGDRIKILESSKDMVFYDDAYDIYITNYALLSRSMKKVKTDQATDLFLPTDKLKNFYENFFETIIIDEVHKCKGVNSQTTNAIKYLCEGASSVLGLTGTPLLNSSKDLYPILNILRPHLFNNYYAFCKRYCIEKVTFVGKRRMVSYYGSRNSEELNAILNNGIMIRQTQQYIKACRGHEFFKPNIKVLPIKPAKTSKYVAAEKQFGIGLANGDDKKKALGNLSKMRVEAWNLKSKECYAFIDDTLEEIDGKLVIFVHNKIVIKDLLEKYGKRMVYIDGSVKTDSDSRNAIRDQFITDSSIDIFVGSISAVAEGLDGLQKASFTMIFLQEAWTAGQRDQCYGRLSNRTGQEHLVNIYHLICVGTIEEMFIKLQDRKERAVKAVIDGEVADEEEMLTNIFEYYKKKYAKKEK